LGADLASLPERRPKRRHWHIDYLLDEPTAEIRRVVAVRTSRRLEPELAAVVASMAGATPFAPGLGAADARGRTHLWATPGTELWWQLLESSVSDVAGEWTRPASGPQSGTRR